MGNEMVVSELTHPLYASMWVCVLHGNVIDYVCHAFGEKTHDETSSWFKSREWAEKWGKWWSCFLHYEEGINLGKEIFGHINDSDIIASVVQDVGRGMSLGMWTLNTAKSNCRKGTKSVSLWEEEEGEEEGAIEKEVKKQS